MFELIALVAVIGLLFWKPYAFRTTKKGAMFIPVRTETVQQAMEYLNLKKGDVFYELGSGDGRVVNAAAMRGATVYGIEVDQLRVWYSRVWIWMLRLPDAHIIKQDFFETDLRDADVVFGYLLPKTLEKLESKFEKELKPTAQVVCIAFPLPNWKLEAKLPWGPTFVYSVKDNLPK